MRLIFLIVGSWFFLNCVSTIMAVLNNIKPYIIDSIIKAITNERDHNELYQSLNQKVKNTIALVSILLVDIIIGLIKSFMTPDIVLVLSLLFFGFILFLTEVFSIDVTAMILLTVLFSLGYLTPEEALSGFSNPAVITIAFLFIISRALQKTRILEYLIIRIRRLADRSMTLGRAVYLFTIGIASAVVNNTAIVAIFMPVTIRLAQKYKISPSKMLIPLSYLAILVAPHISRYFYKPTC